MPPQFDRPLMGDDWSEHSRVGFGALGGGSSHGSHGSDHEKGRRASVASGKGGDKSSSKSGAGSMDSSAHGSETGRRSSVGGSKSDKGTPKAGTGTGGGGGGIVGLIVGMFSSKSSSAKDGTPIATIDEDAPDQSEGFLEGLSKRLVNSTRVKVTPTPTRPPSHALPLPHAFLSGCPCAVSMLQVDEQMQKLSEKVASSLERAKVGARTQLRRGYLCRAHIVTRPHHRAGRDAGRPAGQSLQQPCELVARHPTRLPAGEPLQQPHAVRNLHTGRRHPESRGRAALS